jgi:ubiquinone/menaquinone biosynthesis C-methylase UbiE
MTDEIRNEINRGYVDFIKRVEAKGGKKSKNSIFLHFKRLLELAIRLSALPILFVYGILLISVLRVRLLLSTRNKLPDLYKKAISYVPDFVRQYPMHLYPVVAKSMELAFLKEHMNKVTPESEKSIIELAIGEGTLSRRVFSEKGKVTGFDLNPFSLVQTRQYAHVVKRVVADCLNPPVCNNGASFLICNNLLHHIANKEFTLKNWARIAPMALFNENTNYWASGWFKPFVLGRLGKRWSSQSAAKTIEKKSLQDLWPIEKLDSTVNKYFSTISRYTFLHENVFFLCAVCSQLLFCYGPPTPKMQKKILNTILWPLTKQITYYMAKLLIEYDAILPRNKDVYVIWLVRSKLTELIRVSESVILSCPDCGERLQDNHCTRCNTRFEERDGMLFLLSKKLAAEIKYSTDLREILGAEHL